LEKMARALEVPMYRRIFHEGEAASSIRNLKLPTGSEEWGAKAKKPIIFQVAQATCENGTGRQKLLLHMAQKVAR
jgi:hypothetical protein